MFEVVLRLRAALRRADAFAQSQFHEIIVLRQSDGRAVHERDATMQPVGDREVRRGIVRRKNIRSTDHRELEMSVYFAGINGVGQLEGRGDRTLCRIGWILIKLELFNRDPELWRLRFVGKPFQIEDVDLIHRARPHASAPEWQ